MCNRWPGGPPGAIGPTGPTGTFDVPYLQALSAPDTVNLTPTTIIDYYSKQGSLSSQFDTTTGVFTATVGGVYLITINITYQRFVEGAPQIDDGTRQMRLVRSWLPLEPAFIGQSVWVTLPGNPSGPFYSTFNVKLSASGIIPIPAGGSLYVTSYQDNSGENNIRAFTELEIVQLSTDNTLNILEVPILNGPVDNENSGSGGNN